LYTSVTLLITPCDKLILVFLLNKNGDKQKCRNYRPILILNLPNALPKYLKKCLIEIFLDLKKSFHFVDPKLLIKRLEMCGTSGKALDLLTFFLTNRSNVVEIDNVVTKHEVPQGIVLGPVWFIIYVNSLLNHKINGSYILYAYC
ncbi:Reverse transcriptase domain-containing protein, partial [Aphis craccivora]